MTDYPRTDANCIQTASGRRFWPLNPRGTDVRLEDIAHSLSQKCRYTGHCNGIYSVAQHSVLVSRNCDEPLWGLMHDAAEAFLPDISAPIKPALTGFAAVENRVLEIIARAFGLEMPIPHCVHQADLVLRSTEKRDVMGPSPYPWRSVQGIGPLEQAIIPWAPIHAKQEFLSRYHELF